MFNSFQTPRKSKSVFDIKEEVAAPKKANPKIVPNQGPYIFQAEEMYQQMLTQPNDNQAHYLGVYTSRFIRNKCREIMGENYPFASAYTKMVRDLKNNKTENNRKNAVDFFVHMLLPLIRHGEEGDKTIIAAIPSSTANETHNKKTRHGATLIADTLAELTNNDKGSTIITRNTSKKPCHKGGARTEEAILKGVDIDAAQVRGKKILLIDDVVDTGVNATTFVSLLYSLGATRVVSLGFAGVLNKANEKIGFQSVLEKELIERIKDNQSLEFMRHCLSRMFAAVNQAFPKTPEQTFLPLLRAQITKASIENACKLNFDEEVVNPRTSKSQNQDQDSDDDADISDLVNKFDKLEISGKRQRMADVGVKDPKISSKQQEIVDSGVKDPKISGKLQEIVDSDVKDHRKKKKVRFSLV